MQNGRLDQDIQQGKWGHFMKQKSQSEVDQCVVYFRVMVRSQLMGEARRGREAGGERRRGRERGTIPEELRRAQFPEWLEKEDA